MRTRSSSRIRTPSPLVASRSRRVGLRCTLWGRRRNRRRKIKETKSARSATQAGEVQPTRPVRAPKPPLRQRALAATKAVLVVSVLGGMGWAGYQGYRLAMRSSYLTVRSIRVVGNERASEGELQGALRWTLGRSILGLRTRSVVEAVASHPWVARATAHRRLPSTLEVRVEEHRAVAVVLLGHLYLVNAEGAVFKHATEGEADGLPVISGIERLAFLNGDPAVPHKIERALAALRLYNSKKRPAVGEINVADEDEITLFLRRGGTALRFGQHLNAERLGKLDAVWAALGPDTRRARAVYLDHEQLTQRVVVRLARYQ